MNETKTTYQRLLRSSQAEQILSTSKIHIDVAKLRPHLIGNTTEKSSDLYKFAKQASQNSGYIYTDYDSKTKTTARMFTKRGHLNLITLSDERILSAINSRYENGRIICLDYKAFEPTIISNLLDEPLPDNIHEWASSLLDVPKKVIKVFNMELMYGEDFSYHAKKVMVSLTREYGVDEDSLVEYVDTFKNIRTNIDSYTQAISETYDTKGFVLNSYGRKIYPNHKRNIFNNVIQSIGSEILAEAIIELDKFLNGREAHLLFHRFDALYLDMSKQAILKGLSKIIKIMEGAYADAPLKVGIQIGEGMSSLEDIDSG